MTGHPSGGNEAAYNDGPPEWRTYISFRVILPRATGPNAGRLSSVMEQTWPLRADFPSSFQPDARGDGTSVYSHMRANSSQYRYALFVSRVTGPPSADARFPGDPPSRPLADAAPGRLPRPRPYLWSSSSLPLLCSGRRNARRCDERQALRGEFPHPRRRLQP